MADSFQLKANVTRVHKFRGTELDTRTSNPSALNAQHSVVRADSDLAEGSPSRVPDGLVGETDCQVSLPGDPKLNGPAENRFPYVHRDWDLP